MGVWMDLFVAPKEPLPGEREPFLELVSDLLIEDLVVLPCAILGGAISVEHPLGMANAAAFFPEKARSLLIHRVDVQKMRNLLMKPSQRDAIFMEELLVIK